MSTPSSRPWRRDSRLRSAGRSTRERGMLKGDSRTPQPLTARGRSTWAEMTESCTPSIAKRERSSGPSMPSPGLGTGRTPSSPRLPSGRTEPSTSGERTASFTQSARARDSSRPAPRSCGGTIWGLAFRPLPCLRPTGQSISAMRKGPFMQRGHPNRESGQLRCGRSPPRAS